MPESLTRTNDWLYRHIVEDSSTAVIYGDTNGVRAYIVANALSCGLPQLLQRNGLAVPRAGRYIGRLSFSGRLPQRLWPTSVAAGSVRL
jgi:hypothetical protein